MKEDTAGSNRTFMELKWRWIDWRGSESLVLIVPLWNWNSEIEVVDTVKVVTPTWNLDRSGVSKLLELLNNDFKRSVVEWFLATFDYCTANGKIIARSKAAMLERYLMRYGIDASPEEKDNMRRVVERWIKSEHNFFKAYSCLDMQYEDMSEAEHHIDKICWLQ